MSSPNSSRGYVLITGSSTGIGRACAIHLAQIGFHVLAGIRNEKDAPTGANITPIRIDITDSDSIRQAPERIRANVGSDGLKGIFNNAGVSVVGPIEFVPIADWRKQFEVNLFGHIAVTQAMLPLLRDHVAVHGRFSARIINNASIAGRLGQPILGPYCASKFAMEGLTDSLRRELLGQGIHVSVIEPGAIQSEIWDKGKVQVEQSNASAPQMREHYGQLIDGIKTMAMDAAAKAIPAERVARIIEKCLVSSRPSPRILIGNDAKMAARLNALLPTRWFDAMLLSLFRKGAEKVATNQPTTSRTT